MLGETDSRELLISPQYESISKMRVTPLLSKALPVRIETEEEYTRILKQAEYLMEKEEEELSAEEDRLLDLLTDLIERYEDEHFSISSPKPQEVLRFLMEQRGLRQCDIRHLFSSSGVASEVIRGKRTLSKTQAKKLAEFFHVAAEVFICEES